MKDDPAAATFLSMMAEMKDLLEHNSDQMTQMQVEIRHLPVLPISLCASICNDGVEEHNALGEMTGDLF